MIRSSYNIREDQKDKLDALAQEGTTNASAIMRGLIDFYFENSANTAKEVKSKDSDRILALEQKINELALEFSCKTSRAARK